MAAFHPETLRLLRRDLAATVAQHKRDMERRRKLAPNSKSAMARALDQRISSAMDVTRDLERLIRFAEGVTRLYADHDAGLHDDGPQRLDCPSCISRDTRAGA